MIPFKRITTTVRTACFQASFRNYSPEFLTSSRLRTRRFHQSRSLSASCHQHRGILLARQPQTSKRLTVLLFNSTKRSNSSATNASLPPQKEQLYHLIDRIYAQHEEIVQLFDELELEDLPPSKTAEDLDLLKAVGSAVGYRSEEALEARVRAAWEHYGAFLPPDELHEDGLRLYRRLYGEPIFTNLEGQKEKDRMFREGKDGEWVEVEMPQDQHSTEQRTLRSEHLINEHAKLESPFDADAMSHAIENAQQIAANLGAELITEIPTYDDVDPTLRSHPLVDKGKYGTTPSSITAPAATMTRPITQMASAFSNKHVTETATQIFGGSKLPDAIGVPTPLPKNPIPLTASQKGMSPLDSVLFMSVLYPGMYASILGVLTEIRKRMGTQWIRDLLNKEGGPSILDAGGAGAGIFAWREVLKSEWSLIDPNHEEDKFPKGKSTVLVGSDALRHRVSTLLEDTTFIPRLPDYLRLEESSLGPQKPGNRKNFDIIVASHALLHYENDYQRRDYVKNLWSMLDPEGGILILIEKGTRVGFAAIGGAREMILERLIFSKGPLTEAADADQVMGNAIFQKSKGMIVAPCTTHAKCPMYVDPGREKRPREYCRFAQRYVRPHVLQRILDNPSHNHEDAEFSYIAVQRGVDTRQADSYIQGAATTDAAFVGYEHSLKTDEDNSSPDGQKITEANEPRSWPRIILPPIKRKGHVCMDLCTPEGKIERWTVPRSFSKQAYRDARKSSWGDLWPLGAKTRLHRPVRSVNSEEVKPAKQKVKKPSANATRRQRQNDAQNKRDSRSGGDELVFEEELVEMKEGTETGNNNRDSRQALKSKKEHKVPRWVRQIGVKRERKFGRQAGME